MGNAQYQGLEECVTTLPFAGRTEERNNKAMYISDREYEKILQMLKEIKQESVKPKQRAHKIYNMVGRVQTALRKVYDYNKNSIF